MGPKFTGAYRTNMEKIAVESAVFAFIYNLQNVISSKFKLSLPDQMCKLHRCLDKQAISG